MKQKIILRNLVKISDSFRALSIISIKGKKQNRRIKNETGHFGII